MSVPYPVSTRGSSAQRPRTETERSPVTPIQELDHILTGVATSALHATRATSVVIGLLQGEDVICRATAGRPLTGIGSPINCETGLTGLALRRQMSQWCNDTEYDGRVDIGACRHFGIRSIIVAPIYDLDVVIGIFAIFSPDIDAFSLANVSGVKILAEQVTEAIESTVGHLRPPVSAIACVDSTSLSTQQPETIGGAGMKKKGRKSYVARIWRDLVMFIPWYKNGRTG
jgi:putative methionine-R-sulfoxide reductase with GAF domain